MKEWTADYPREDKCRYCLAHVGWIAHELGEMFALGVCDSPECQEKHKQRAASRKILEESFGEPANKDRARIIEEILDKMYGPCFSPHP